MTSAIDQLTRAQLTKETQSLSIVCLVNCQLSTGHLVLEGVVYFIYFSGSGNPILSAHQKMFIM